MNRILSTEAVQPSATPETAPPGEGYDRLSRQLGVWSAAAVLVGSTIGSGIFRVAGGENGVADRVGTVGAIGLIWILGAVIALFGALAIAELAAAFPRSGGIYVFLREAYGPLPAFLFGWTELLVIRPSALGAISMIFSEYAGQLFGYGAGGVRVVAALAIFVLAIANIRSVRWGAAVQNTSAVAKVAALVGLAVVAFLFGDFSRGALSAGPVEWEPLAWGAFGLALVRVMWAYDGWADLTFMAGEVKDPGRTMPRAIIGGVLAVAAVYLTVNLAYLFVLTVPEMIGSDLVAATLSQKIFGQAGSAVVAALVMVSAFGALNGSTMTGPRILYAMAEDGLFFRPVASVHPSYRTPWVAIALAAGLGILYVSVRDFAELADAFVLGIWPFYALAVFGVYRLRARRPELPRPYRTFGYPITPIVFVLASVGMLLNSAIQNPVPTGIGFAVILAGIPVFYLWYGKRARTAG